MRDLCACRGQLFDLWKRDWIDSGSMCDRAEALQDELQREIQRSLGGMLLASPQFGAPQGSGRSGDSKELGRARIRAAGEYEVWAFARGET